MALIVIIAPLAGLSLLTTALGAWEFHLSGARGVPIPEPGKEPGANWRGSLGFLRIMIWLLLNLNIVIIVWIIFEFYMNNQSWAPGTQGKIAAAVFIVLLIWFGTEIVSRLLVNDVEKGGIQSAVNRIFRRLDQWFLKVPIRKWEPIEALGRFASLSDEIHFLTRVGEIEGEIKGEEADLITRALELSRPVSDIMAPAEKIAWAAADMDREVLLRRFAECGFSRLPVMDSETGEIPGFLHIKDVLIHVLRPAEHSTGIRDLVRRIIFVGPETPIVDLLSGFRNERAQLALVREPGGRIAGLVALEDVLEELVGDIFDERETVDKELRPDV